MQKNSPQTMKNAAVCIFGMAKNFELCYPYFKKNLLDVLGSYDVFCCVEDDENASKIGILKPVRLKKIKSSDVEPLIREDVRALKRQKYIKNLFIESSRFNIRNLYQQLYKINQVFELLTEYMKEKKVGYKYFLKLRFDLLLMNKLNPEDFGIKDNEIIVPSQKMPMVSDAVNDMLCITCNFDVFRSYCSLYNNFRKIIEEQFLLKTNFLQRLYLLCEKGYSNFFFLLLGKLSKKKKIYRNLLGAALFIPKKFYKNFKNENKCYLERILFHHLKSENKEIRKMKMDFIIVRSLDEGFLIFG